MPSGPLLSDAAIRYVAERRKRGEFSLESTRTIRSILTRFVRIIGDRPVNTVTKRHVRKWWSSLNVGASSTRRGCAGLQTQASRTVQGAGTTVGARMAGSVHRLPNPNGGDGLGPVDLYKSAVEEYRFQAQFNWSRTQYMLALNVAILTAAAAVASRPGRSAGLVFGLGIAAAVLSALAVRTQHDYYRAARDRMRRVEDVLGVPAEQRVDTTATLGNRKRTVSVNQVVFLLLAAVAIGDAVGAVLMLTR